MARFMGSGYWGYRTSEDAGDLIEAEGHEVVDVPLHFVHMADQEENLEQLDVERFQAGVRFGLVDGRLHRRISHYPSWSASLSKSFVAGQLREAARRPRLSLFGGFGDNSPKSLASSNRGKSGMKVGHDGLSVAWIPVSPLSYVRVTRTE